MVVWNTACVYDLHTEGKKNNAHTFRLLHTATVQIAHKIPWRAQICFVAPNYNTMKNDFWSSQSNRSFHSRFIFFFSWTESFGHRHSIWIFKSLLFFEQNANFSAQCADTLDLLYGEIECASYEFGSVATLFFSLCLLPHTPFLIGQYSMWIFAATRSPLFCDSSFFSLFVNICLNVFSSIFLFFVLAHNSGGLIVVYLF